MTSTMSQQSSDYLFFQGDTADTDTFGDYFPQLQTDLSSDPATSPESSFSPVFSATTGTYSLPQLPPTAGPGDMDEWTPWENSKDGFSPQDLFDADPAFAASPTIDPLDLSGSAVPASTTIASRNADILPRHLFAPSSPMASPPALPSPLDLPRGSLWQSNSDTTSAINIRGGGRAPPRKRKSEPAVDIDDTEETATGTFRRRRQQQQEASTSPSSRQTSSSNRRGQQPGRRSKYKADHGEVEQRYRNKLNAQITALRDVVQRSRDANAASNSYESNLDQEDDDDKRNGDPSAALTKGAILTQAAAYIGELERRNRVLESENRILRARVQRRLVATMQQGEGVAGSGWC